MEGDVSGNRETFCDTGGSEAGGALQQPSGHKFPSLQLGGNQGNPMFGGAEMLYHLLSP